MSHDNTFLLLGMLPMRRILTLAAIVALLITAHAKRHDLLEWWRFDRFGTHQPITQDDYRRLGQ